MSLAFEPMLWFLETVLRGDPICRRLLMPPQIRCLSIHNKRGIVKKVTYTVSLFTTKLF